MISQANRQGRLSGSEGKCYELFFSSNHKISKSKALFESSFLEYIL